MKPQTRHNTFARGVNITCPESFLLTEVLWALTVVVVVVGLKAHTTTTTTYSQVGLLCTTALLQLHYNYNRGPKSLLP